MTWRSALRVLKRSAGKVLAEARFFEPPSHSRSLIARARTPPELRPPYSEQLDAASIAAKLAPELAAKLVGTIQLDALGNRVLEKLACTLANDATIVEAVLTQLLARLGA
jgi:hypothetical protein